MLFLLLHYHFLRIGSALQSLLISAPGLLYSESMQQELYGRKPCRTMTCIMYRAFLLFSMQKSSFCIFYQGLHCLTNSAPLLLQGMFLRRLFSGPLACQCLCRLLLFFL